jgi:plasmid stabilization system protein ParE
VLSALAARDLDDILDTLETHSLRAAAAFETYFTRTLALLVAHPEMGAVRRDLTRHPVRFKLVQSRYFVIYQEGPPLRVVRVLEAQRDLLEALKDPLP